ncbi:MAG TPA: VCBS repeat-containing protein [Kofleriaceae bacterium]|nr:VCBS repeat-containing protein [Kofleriaceae bacterium]
MRRALLLLLIASCQRNPDHREAPSSSGSATPQVSTPAPVSTSSSSTTATPPAPSPTPPAVDRPPPPPLPDPLPGTRKDLTAAIGQSWRAAIGDFNGDGKNEIAVASSAELKVIDANGTTIATTPATDGIQRLVAADLDGDGRAELYAGWGQTRDHMDTKAKVTVHRLDKGSLTAETVLAPETTRQEVVALVPMKDAKSLFIAYFDSKYMVTSTIAQKGAQGWAASKVAQLRTATSYARGDVNGDGKPDIVVGRVYGDDKGVDGDAFVLAADGTRTKIPSTRGMRSIAVIDADGDGKPEVYMGDGWHQNYGQYAHGLLTRAKFAGGAFQTDLVEDTVGQYGIEEIVPATVDGKIVLLTAGSNYTRAFMRTGDHWSGLTIGPVARDIVAGDLDGKPGDEILLLGEKSEIVNLRGVVWPK